MSTAFPTTSFRQIAAPAREPSAIPLALRGLLASPPKRATGRPMRIAVVGGRGVPSHYSGVETIVENLFGAFADAGHKVTVYCRPGVLDEPFADYKGMRLVRAPAPGGKLGTITHTAASCWHAARHGATNDGGEPFDCVSFHAIPGNLAQLVPAFAGIPAISHVHGLDHQREKWKGLGARLILEGEREMVRRAAHVVTVNRSIVDYYKRTYGIDATLLPNGIHATGDAFKPCRATLERFGLRAGGYLVMVSRLVPEKRHQDAIAAFARVNANCKLVIVGEGNHSDDYVDAIKRQAANDPRVVFTGLQKGEALQTLFRCAAAYVTASELEGMPSSLLECMERAVCPIVSEIAPHIEVTAAVKDYDFAFHVGDVATLCRHMQRAIGSPDRVATLAMRARAFVRANYAWPVLADRTIELYRDVLSRTRRKD